MATKKNPVALVTGAGVRLGKAIALGLATSGCDVVLHCNASRGAAEKTAAAIRSKGRRAAVLSADLADADAVKGLARDAEKAFGRIDILVNSAAIFYPTPLENLERDFDAFLNINLRAPYLLSAEIGRRMKKRGAGTIVNIACLSGSKAWKTYLPYSISKAGVISLTQGLAKLLAPEVRVNAIAPGTVLPPEAMPKAEIEAIRQRLPLQRIGRSDDVVGAVLYLVQADFVTGQVLNVDGGRSLV